MHSTLSLLSYAVDDLGLLRSRSTRHGIYHSEFWLQHLKPCPLLPRCHCRQAIGSGSDHLQHLRMPFFCYKLHCHPGSGEHYFNRRVTSVAENRPTRSSVYSFLETYIPRTPGCFPSTIIDLRPPKAQNISLRLNVGTNCETRVSMTIGFGVGSAVQRVSHGIEWFFGLKRRARS